MIDVFKWRYTVSRWLILLGIQVMPNSAYKALLIVTLYRLRKQVEDAVAKEKKFEELSDDFERKEHADS